jgi:hypothetical protein
MATTEAASASRPPQVPNSGVAGVRVPIELYAYALSRFAWSTDSARLFLSEPNVLTRHEGLSETAEGRIAGWTAFDVVANAVDVVPDGTTNPVPIRVRQGVLDTNAESYFAAAAGGATNISEFAIDPSRWRLQSSGGHGPNPVDGTRLIVEAADDAEAASAGSWRVDRKTGTCLGMTRNGWGGTPTAETSKTNEEVSIKTARVVQQLADIILCVAAVHVKALAEERKAQRAGKRRVDTGADAFFYMMCVYGKGLSAAGTATGSQMASLMGGGMSSVATGLSLYQAWQALR